MMLCSGHATYNQRIRCKREPCFQQWIGTYYCDHQKSKYICSDPVCAFLYGAGKGLCSHGRRKETCRHPECLPFAKSLCQHGKRKDSCVEEPCRTQAHQICPLHHKRKSMCECTTLSYRKTVPSTWCQACLVKRSVIQRHCRACFHQIQTGSIRIRLEHLLISHMMEYHPQWMHSIHSCDRLEGHHRKDLQWILQNQYRLVLEIDEEGHQDRETSCELARYEDIAKHTPAPLKATVVIRLSTEEWQELTNHQLEWMTSFLVALSQPVSFMYSPYWHVASPYQLNIVFLRYYRKGRKHILAAHEASRQGTCIHRVFDLFHTTTS
jgi:hypothetical protein